MIAVRIREGVELPEFALDAAPARTDVDSRHVRDVDGGAGL
jgi:hypothetical protein